MKTTATRTIKDLKITSDSTHLPFGNGITLSLPTEIVFALSTPSAQALHKRNNPLKFQQFENAKGVINAHQSYKRRSPARPGSGPYTAASAMRCGASSGSTCSGSQRSLSRRIFVSEYSIYQLPPFPSLVWHRRSLICMRVNLGSKSVP